MRKFGAFVATLLLMCLAGTAQAVPTATNISGSLSKAEDTCVSPIALFTAQMCSYSGGEDVNALVGQGNVRTWMGPLDSGGYYPKGFLVDPGTTGGFSGSTPGDGKIALPFTGTITIENNNTPADGSDDSISGTIAFGPGERAASSSDGNVVERFDSVTYTLPTTVASSATSNALGGFDYVIGSAGFPILHHSGPGGDDYPSEVGSTATGDTLPPDVNVWDQANGGSVNVMNPGGGPYTVEIVSYAPANGNVGPNVGMATTAVVTGLTCEDGDADADPKINADGEPIDDCNPDPAIGAGSSWTVSGPEWDNLILKLSTDAKGHVVSADAFYALEYKIVALPLENQGKPGNFIGGTLSFAGLTEAVDDTAKTTQDSPKTIDILANDALFADPVTITLPGGGASANGGTVVINGTNPGAQAAIDVTYTPPPAFVGSDTFTYRIDDGTTSQVATVSVQITSSGSGGNQIPNAPDANLNTGEDQPIDVVLPLLLGINLGDGIPAITISSLPAHGKAQVQFNTTTITYTPAPFFFGSDSFGYTIVDEDGESDSGTVTLVVGPQLKPTAIDDPDVTVDQDSSVNIPVTDNDFPGSGPLGDHVVTISFEPVSGTAVVEADNTVTYTPNPGVSGVHIFRYTLTDGDQDVSAEATVTITVKKAQGTTVQLPHDSSSALGPWSLMFLAGIAWLRRQRSRFFSG